MEILKNISEYYDELFEIDSSQKIFFEKLEKTIQNPVRYLQIACGTGLFEHFLAQRGADVTGIENVQELLEIANRRRRSQLMSLRFFNMSSLEMARFLGKKFYNIISILNWRLIFKSDAILLEKLFFDCKSLLANNGILVVAIPNFDKLFCNDEFFLPKKESIRAELRSVVRKNRNGVFILNQTLSNSSGKLIYVTKDAPICTPKSSELEKIALKQGFSSVQFFAGFDDKSKNELVGIFR